MSHLSLAVDIADTVMKADQEARKVDAPIEAERLLKEHPEATTSKSDVVEAISEVTPSPGR